MCKIKHEVKCEVNLLIPEVKDDEREERKNTAGFLVHTMFVQFNSGKILQLEPSILLLNILCNEIGIIRGGSQIHIYNDHLECFCIYNIGILRSTALFVMC